MVQGEGGLVFKIKLALALTSGVASAQTGGAQTFPLPGEEVYPGGVKPSHDARD